MARRPPAGAGAAPASNVNPAHAAAAGALRHGVGQRVFFEGRSGLEPGVVRFCGPTHFGEGEWVGIELDKGIGKNDGSIRGVSYFQCAPRHGIFCRASRVRAPGAEPLRRRQGPRQEGPRAAAGVQPLCRRIVRRSRASEGGCQSRSSGSSGSASASASASSGGCGEAEATPKEGDLPDKESDVGGISECGTVVTTREASECGTVLTEQGASQERLASDAEDDAATAADPDQGSGGETDTDMPQLEEVPQKPHEECEDDSPQSPSGFGPQGSTNHGGDFSKCWGRGDLQGLLRGM